MHPLQATSLDGFGIDNGPLHQFLPVALHIRACWRDAHECQPLPDSQINPAGAGLHLRPIVGELARRIRSCCGAFETGLHLAPSPARQARTAEGRTRHPSSLCIDGACLPCRHRFTLRRPASTAMTATSGVPARQKVRIRRCRRKVRRSNRRLPNVSGPCGRWPANKRAHRRCARRSESCQLPC